MKRFDPKKYKPVPEISSEVQDFDVDDWLAAKEDAASTQRTTIVTCSSAWRPRHMR